MNSLAGPACSEHPHVAAEFACDGCARLLCAACTREGHRLIFCAHCGERAIALAPYASSSVPERQRSEKVERPYPLSAALAYSFRGSGRMMLPSYAIGLTLASLVPIFGGLFSLLVLVLLPGLLFEIVRTTSSGEIELPEWPDFTDFFDRFREVAWFLTIYALALLPAAFLFYLTDCDFVAFVLGSSREACWGPLVGGTLLGAVLAVFAFGATGTHSSGWLTFRIDLHLRALLSEAGLDGVKTAALLAVLLLAGRLAADSFDEVPLLGTLVASTLSGYALFTSAHLVGLIFRRHGQTLDAIYRD